MTNREYKKLTLREFDAVAEKFDNNETSVYNMCRKDYPDLLEIDRAARERMDAMLPA